MPDREGAQPVKGGPSEAAVQAACAPVLVTAADWEGPWACRWPLTEEQARQALDAAHDTALGLDRSVRLGDVVAALGSYDAAITPGWAAEVIAREFGATTHAE